MFPRHAKRKKSMLSPSVVLRLQLRINCGRREAMYDTAQSHPKTCPRTLNSRGSLPPCDGSPPCVSFVAFCPKNQPKMPAATTMSTTTVFQSIVCSVDGGAGGGVSAMCGTAGDRPDQSDPRRSRSIGECWGWIKLVRSLISPSGRVSGFGGGTGSSRQVNPR